MPAARFASFAHLFGPIPRAHALGLYADAVFDSYFLDGLVQMQEVGGEEITAFPYAKMPFLRQMIHFETFDTFCAKLYKVCHLVLQR